MRVHLRRWLDSSRSTRDGSFRPVCRAPHRVHLCGPEVSRAAL